MHNQMIEEQVRTPGMRLGELAFGGKKHKVGQIAIYGWHRGPGGADSTFEHRSRRQLRRLQPRNSSAKLL
jgi:hypothetical protein